ncbi:MAG: hypothetical protein KJ709_08135 [Nanoarchaeota archaeon]|nr:hypothetical protein [Nanoarchaeota archaeon]
MVRKIQKMDPGAELFRWGPIDGKPIYPYTFMQAIEKYPRSSGVSWPNLFLHFKRDRMTFICEYKELRDQGEKLYDMNKDRLAKGHARWQKTVSRLKKHEQAVNKGLSDVPDSELLRLLKSFEQDYLEFWLTGLLPEFTNWGVERLLKDEIMKTHRKDFIEIFEALSAPERLSFFQEEELDFMELKLEEGKKGFANRLKKHAEDYHWLRNSYAHTQRLGEKHFKDGLKEISTEEAREKIKEIKGLPGKVKQNKQEVIKKYSLGKEVVESADWIAYCIWWQDLRKKYIFMSCSIISAFVHEISKRKKIPYEELCYHTPDELLQLLSKGRKADARARQEGFMIYYEKEGRLSFISQDANDLARPFIETRIDKMTEQLRGLVVSKGKGSVRGKVRILLSPRDHMGEGDILVTTMTSPDFVVAMRKAKAIVTDEGGMTSHAAIISRELGIPCIVGTGMATKLLKDGDIVTVDVERGLIRKELCPKSDG